MPIYEYACQNEQCRHVTEKLRKVSQADDPVPCPKCESTTKRKVSQASFQLKGGGWASDGYGG